MNFAQAAQPSYNPDKIARDFLWSEFQNLPSGKRPHVGLVLSGGGARGFAHVGVMEVLANAGFPIDSVVGTSMGAVMGAFFCAGLPFSKMWELGEKASYSDVSKDINTIGILRLLLGQRLFSSQEIENFITGNIGNVTFAELKTKFACTAMDIKTGERVVFREGPVAIAVRASMNLPGIFQPVQYRHRYLVDGGVANFLPVEIGRGLGADWILASVTIGDVATASLDNTLKYLLQVMDIRGAILAEAAMKQADFVVKPDIDDINFTELDKSVEAGKRGIEAMTASLDSAKESLVLFSMVNIMGKYGAH